MFLVQGTITTLLGLVTYVWMVDFPENSQHSVHFLTPEETALAVSRINLDRNDSGPPTPFEFRTSVLKHFLDPKLYAFCLLFFLLNIVSTALSYFLPIILQSGMGFSSNKAILLSSPPYYYAVIPVVLSSYLADKYRMRGPIIIFNALSHCWVCHAWLSVSSDDPILGYLPCNWRIHLQLGGPQCVPGQQYNRSVEACYHSCGCDGLQWPGWYCG
jgi:sugar phosphate permease